MHKAIDYSYNTRAIGSLAGMGAPLNLCCTCVVTLLLATVQKKVLQIWHPEPEVVVVALLRLPKFYACVEEHVRRVFKIGYYLGFCQIYVLQFAAFHENDGNHENDENDAFCRSWPDLEYLK